MLYFLVDRIVRVSKKNTIFIPKDIAKTIGISEGSYFILTVKDHMLIITPLPDPFWLALKGSKFAETTVEEIKSMSE
uniref:AbrB/MazE/SpoVT family DNA-binding domain-containing protein n=1 Tax=Thermofilum adornatum TaxID=1365176 RepID=A0A7C1GKE9_9CREN